MRNPRHILITGASSGIGAALAVLYAGPVRRLSLHGRNAERLSRIAADAAQKGSTTSVHIGDVTNSASMTAWIKECDAAQPLDLVIANAGISAGSGGFMESSAQAQAIFATNLNGVLNTVEPTLPLMMRRHKGQIAIMSSLAGFHGLAGAPAYCASKAAVRVYGEALRVQLKAFDVNVNIICPGFIKTPLTDTNRFPMPFIMDAERAARIIQKGLERDHARIAFPWPMYAAVRLFTMLPEGLTDKIMGLLPRKGG